MFDNGDLAGINNYCRCDVLDTYFVFLRTMVLLGTLTLEREQEIVMETKQWLDDRAERMPSFAVYLNKWGDWQNPWGTRKNDEL